MFREAQEYEYKHAAPSPRHGGSQGGSTDGLGGADCLREHGFGRKTLADLDSTRFSGDQALPADSIFCEVTTSKFCRRNSPKTRKEEKKKKKTYMVAQFKRSQIALSATLIINSLNPRWHALLDSSALVSRFKAPRSIHRSRCVHIKIEKGRGYEWDLNCSAVQKWHRASLTRSRVTPPPSLAKRALRVSETAIRLDWSGNKQEPFSIARQRRRGYSPWTRQWFGLAKVVFARINLIGPDVTTSFLNLHAKDLWSTRGGIPHAALTQKKSREALRHEHLCFHTRLKRSGRTCLRSGDRKAWRSDLLRNAMQINADVPSTKAPATPKKANSVNESLLDIQETSRIDTATSGEPKQADSLPYTNFKTSSGAREVIQFIDTNLKESTSRRETCARMFRLEAAEFQALSVVWTTKKPEPARGPQANQKVLLTWKREDDDFNVLED
ncbi:hypothetical protein B0H11DRAFT_1922353 [Mycena galericulata]|nr:hypothetical protein B0H11DRAFT_1922353 [Mycena galericulata]